jgi:hypothetical protein
MESERTEVAEEVGIVHSWKSYPLFDDRDEYRRYLELLRRLLGMLRAKNAAAADAGPADNGTALEGPEYVPGNVTGAVRCEWWTRPNKTVPAAWAAICGITCRLDTDCKGFAIDPHEGVCVWFQKTEPAPSNMSKAVAFSNLRNLQPLRKAPGLALMQSVGGYNKPGLALMQSAGGYNEPVCSSLAESTFVKVKCVTKNEKILEQLTKVRKLRGMLVDLMDYLYIQEHVLVDNVEYSTENLSAVKGLNNLSSSTGNYTSQLETWSELRAAYFEAVEELYAMTTLEALTHPPIGTETTTTTTSTTTTTTTTQTLTTPPMNMQAMLTWADEHPGCPRGTPCVCNCICRRSLPKGTKAGPPAGEGPPAPKPCLAVGVSDSLTTPPPKLPMR